MKPFIAVLLILSACLLCAQDITQITDDYRAQIKKELDRINSTLQKQGAEIAAKLVSNGDTQGAEIVADQVKELTDGKPVLTPHKALTMLSVQYSNARRVALAPHQEVALKKLDALLKTQAGKDMAFVIDVAKAKQQIESGEMKMTKTTADLLTEDVIAKEWTYHAHPSGAVLDGFVTIQPTGTFELKGKPGSTDQTPGTWEATNNPMVIKIKLGNGESGTITFDGKEAVMQRAIGTRYLKKKK